MTDQHPEFPGDAPVSNRLYAIADILDEEAILRGKLEISKEDTLGVAKYLRDCAADARRVEVTAQGGAKIYAFTLRVARAPGGDAA